LVGGRKLLVRVDRVELSKNILRGFWAFEELLDTRPRWRGQVVFLALVYPSRQGLADYLAYRAEVEHTAARINETWGTPDWTPIVLDVADDRDRSVAALTRYDVLLVNPVRDGLNLVAKEGPLLNQADGVLVLSREAGAWDELAGSAIGINPFDVTETAGALDLALGMDDGERCSRAAALRSTVRGRTADDWFADQLAAADRIS
jgi:trehalose 6-phosphate synthase